MQQADRAVRGREPLDVFLRRHFKARPQTGGSERRLLADTIFSYFRWLGWLQQLAVLGPETVAGLALLLEARKPHPVADALLSRSMLRDCGYFPLGDLSLVEKSAALSGWIYARAGSLVAFSAATERLVPHWFESALYCPAGADAKGHLLCCIESFQSRPPTWLSPAPACSEALLAELGRRGLEARRHPLQPDAIAVSGALDLGPVRSRLKGFFIVQDLASQCVVAACGAGPGQRWWDTCAGAGGKTIGLLRHLRGSGSVLATDRRSGILHQLEKRVEDADLVGLSTGVLDATRNAPSGTLFDGVLVDAPCSGMGTWSRNPDARWRTRENEPKQRAGLQAEILARAAESVAAGGVLVYAVCTLSRAETVEVLDAFLDGHPSFSLDPVAHPLSGDMVDGRIWIWPWQGPGDGMFIARLRRR